jgi:aryl-alcohol dehydrogenase-like predicted oxidoreductase
MTDTLTGQPDAIVRRVRPELVRWLTEESIFNDKNYEILEKLTAFAEARGHGVLELAIAWLAGQAGVGSVLVGVSSSKQLEQNARAVDWRLTARELAEVAEITASSLVLQPVPTTV